MSKPHNYVHVIIGLDTVGFHEIEDDILQDIHGLVRGVGLNGDAGHILARSGTVPSAVEAVGG